jgi:glycosyltransferase involved in cell wall biosynthesis
MKLSVIITLYNEEKYITRCLSSLKEQSLKDFEIIVVDDGSVDKTLSVLSKLKIKNEKLKILRQKHQGLAAARNLGAQKAKGKILVFVDGDMFFDKDFLKKLVYPIEVGKTKGVYSLEERIANWDNVWARCWNYNWRMPDRRRVDPKRADQQKEFRAILKSEFDKAGGLNSVGYTDAWSLSEKLGYQPTATKALYYHYNPSSLREVFTQAKWVAKRKYKLGILGKVIALLRANPVFSLINGLIKSFIKKESGFVIFKIVYDFGITFGLLERKKYA